MPFSRNFYAALMLYAEAGRIYGTLLHTRKMEDLLRMEGEYRLMNSMLAEMKAGAWMGRAAALKKCPKQANG